MIGLLALIAAAAALLVALLTIMLAYEMVHPPRRTAADALASGQPCDPGDLGLAFEEWSLDRPGGTTLPVWEIGRAAAQQADQPLTAVFIHGWGHSRIDALHRIQAILPLVDCVVLPELRGHGEAAGGLTRLGEVEVQDILALLEELGDGRFLLLGHSMGAVIAIKAAAEAPQAIAGVIAYAPYMDFHRSLRGRLGAAGYPARPMTDLALLVHRLRGVRPLGLARRDLESMQCPLLIFHGSDDPVAPAEYGRAIAQACEIASFHIVEGARHADAHMVSAAEHDRVLRAFITALRDEPPGVRA